MKAIYSIYYDNFPVKDAENRLAEMIDFDLQDEIAEGLVGEHFTIKKGLNEVDKCVDNDSDCKDVTDKMCCYFFDISTGYCPYLIN